MKKLVVLITFCALLLCSCAAKSSTFTMTTAPTETATSEVNFTPTPESSPESTPEPTLESTYSFKSIDPAHFYPSDMNNNFLCMLEKDDLLDVIDCAESSAFNVYDLTFTTYNQFGIIGYNYVTANDEAQESDSNGQCNHANLTVFFYDSYSDAEKSYLLSIYQRIAANLLCSFDPTIDIDDATVSVHYAVGKMLDEPVSYGMMKSYEDTTRKLKIKSSVVFTGDDAILLFGVALK